MNERISVRNQITDSYLCVPLFKMGEICREFAESWTTDSSQRINGLLDEVPLEHHETLLRNLLSIDLARRQLLGETPATENYFTALGERASLVQDDFFLASTFIQNTLASDTVSFSAQATAPKNRPTLPPGFQLGDYILESELGRGGMGVVFVARHLKLGTRVALKTLPGTSAGELHRFKLEFRTLADINHPNLIGLHSLQSDGGQWFFTMDLVEGCNLLEYVRPKDRLDEQRLRDAMCQLVQGIQELHQHGIIHRDLKPSNVMVTSDGNVLVLDFGLVADLDRVSKSQDEIVIAGTPPYMAPEQFESQAASPAVDWYALGVILYEAISGRLPFSGAVQDIYIAKKSDQFSKLSSRECPDLVMLCQRLISKAPDNRPSFLEIATVVGLASNGVEAEYAIRDNARLTSEGLAGRDSEIDEIDQIVTNFVANSPPHVIMISARSGEGKTVLVDHFLKPMWTDRDYWVLSGRCYDRESVPFKAVDNLIDALCGRLLTLQSDVVKKMLTPDVAVLAQLFPVLQRVSSIAALGSVSLDNFEPVQVRKIAAGALRELLVKLARMKKVVCFIDDLQWGDQLSAELLLDVLEHPESPSLLMFATFRSDEAGESAFLQAWKNRAIADGSRLQQTDIPLKQLTLEQCIELVVAIIGADTEEVRSRAAELAEETERNPFLLSELARCYDPSHPDHQVVQLNDVIQRKLEKLPPDARQLLNVVSVSGKALIASEAAGSAGQDTVPLATINRMRSERLLRLVGDEQSLTLDTYHDRVRETILRDLPVETRRELHISIASNIEKTLPADGNQAAGPRVFDLAYHYHEGCGGEKWDDQPLAQQAMRYCTEAGKRAFETFAFEDAVGFLEKADKIHLDQSPTETYELQYSLASAHARTRDVSNGIAYYEKAFTLTDNPTQRAECKAGLGDIYLKVGNIRAAQSSLASALSELGESQPKTLLGKLVGIAISDIQFLFLPKLLHWRRNSRSLDEQRLIARIYHVFCTTIANNSGMGAFYTVTRNAVVQKYTPDIPTRTMAFSTYAYFNSMGGMAWKGRRFRKWAEQQIVATPTEWWQAAVAQNLGSYHLFTGNLPRAEELLTASLALFRKSRDWQYSLALHWLRHTHSAIGDVKKIIETASMERENASQTHDTVIDAWGKYGLADGLARSGQYSQAVQLAQEAEAVLDGASHHVCLQELARTLLNASRYREAAEAARRCIRETLTCAIVEISADGFPIMIEALLGEHWATDRRAISKANHRSARFYSLFALCLGFLFCSLRPHCTRVRGRLAVASGRNRKGARLFTKAIQVAEQSGARYELARALIDRSRLRGKGFRVDYDRGCQLLNELGGVLPPKERPIDF
ncbi:MAG: protein kinase domain-containing protein [Pirellula sp.]|jgi:serine/threonine protein kinase/tetratricopeptide (TPR) repeat protein